MTTVLVCTVGGSHEPIVKAILGTRPHYVYFVCTDRDPTSNKPGSRTQIEGKGSVIKRHLSDQTPSLPNIPTQVGLEAGTYETVIVRADDLDGIFQRLDSLFSRLVSEDNDRRIIADYTGGTKSMTAGLVLAGLEHPEVELQLVTGSRPDLREVQRGTERPLGTEVERLRVERRLRQALRTWQRFAYEEAVTTIDAIGPVRDTHLHSLLVQAKSISSAFAAWDRFDHDKSRQTLDGFRAVLAPHGYITYFDTLSGLADRKSRDFVLLLDLWRNAQRRAAQGRYDDAVGRCYRLLEASVQWILHHEAGIDTADVPSEKIPEGFALTANAGGRCQVGQRQAWQLAACCVGGRIADFYQSQERRMLSLLQNRNSSILAHGWTPVAQTAWQSWARWIEEVLLPLLLEWGESIGITDLPPQLPDRYPDVLLKNQEGGDR